MWHLAILLFVSYILISWYTLTRSASPALPCHHSISNHQQCFRPLVAPGELLHIELWLYHPPLGNHTTLYRWNPVDTCRFNVMVPESVAYAAALMNSSTSEPCQVLLPPTARRRSSNSMTTRPLKARFVLRRDSDGREVGRTHFDLTRVERRRERFWSGASGSKARNLLATDAPSLSAQPLPDSSKSNGSEAVWIPFLKYGRSPVRIRLVSDFNEYGILQRSDGTLLQAWNRTHYKPIVYVDDLSLQYSSRVELAPPEDRKPAINLRVKVTAISPAVDAFRRQMIASVGLIETVFDADQLDEIRYYLADERLYRFLITQVISYVHMTVAYLAFRDEIRFYRGKKKMSGVSSSSVVTRLACSVIIFLYLLDVGGTSWVVLLSIFGECVIEAWKTFKVLQPTVTSHFPFVVFRQLQTQRERETIEYDRIAMKYLAVVFYPLVAAWSLYALQKYEYKSWYSWLISNLANAGKRFFNRCQ